MTKKLFFLLLLTCVLIPESARNETVSRQDIEVLINSLKYLRGIGNRVGVIHIAAIYDSNINESKKEAEDFVETVNRLTSDKELGMKAQPISLNTLDSKRDFHMAFVPHNMNNHYARIYKFAVENNVFTFSKDKNSVKTQCSILCLNTESGIEIFLNQKTLRALGFEVDAAFRFMVKRL